MNSTFEKHQLKKLSQSQLIKMLMKQEEEKPIERHVSAPRNIKQMDKPEKKQKTAYNLDNLFEDEPFPDFVIKNDPFERTMIKLNNKRRDINEQSFNIDSKYQNLKSNRVDDSVNTQNIRDYPMIAATLDDFRKSEIKLSTDKNRAKLSFVELFETRLDDIPGKREMVSVSVDVKIAYEEDKVLSTKTVNVGPYVVEKPVNSNVSIYKFAMYVLLKNGFNTLSGESIVGIGCKMFKLTKKQIKKHKMGNLKLESYLLNKQRPITSHGENTCVVDYIWDQVRGQRGFKTYTYDKLKEEIYDYVPEGDMISTEELIDWAKVCHNNVSIHAFDCRYKKFITHSNHCSNISLVYIVKDHHCFPITDEKLKIVAAKANQGGCDDLLEHMSELRWTRRHENVMKINSVDEIVGLEKENHIVVLPEEVKMKDAIDTYSKNENFYVEHLHWNNNSILDRFIDHKRNMFLLNEEYNTRKTICDKIYDTYKTYDFEWTNQSYTAIATSLFKQLRAVCCKDRLRDAR